MRKIQTALAGVTDFLLDKNSILEVTDSGLLTKSADNVFSRWTVHSDTPLLRTPEEGADPIYIAFRIPREGEGCDAAINLAIRDINALNDGIGLLTMRDATCNPFEKGHRYFDYELEGERLYLNIQTVLEEPELVLKLLKLQSLRDHVHDGLAAGAVALAGDGVRRLRTHEDEAARVATGVVEILPAIPASVHILRKGGNKVMARIDPLSGDQSEERWQSYVSAVREQLTAAFER